ncbi:hypothetical protein DMUE_5895, partial [Dictyocoela muelleri]
EMNKICYLIILIRKYAENYTRGKQKRRVFRNIPRELKKVISDKSLSPIVIHRIVEYFAYLRSVDMSFENDFDRTFSMKLFSAKKFNKTIQECKKQLIINSACEAGGKIDNFVENIIKISPNDLDNIYLSCKDYEKICPYVYRNDFIVFQIYSLLERMVKILEKTKNFQNLKNLLGELNRFTEYINYDRVFFSYILETGNKLPSWIKENNRNTLLGVIIDINTFDYDETVIFNWESPSFQVFNLFYSFEDETYFIILLDDIFFYEQYLFLLIIMKNFHTSTNYFYINNVTNEGFIRVINNFLNELFKKNK